MTKKKYVFFLIPSPSLSPSSLSLPTYLAGCPARWQELSSEKSLPQQTAVTPHQTSSKPCGPRWRHSWVDGHDHSLTDRINPPNWICLCSPVSNLCLLASVCLLALACLSHSAHVHVTVVLNLDKVGSSPCYWDCCLLSRLSLDGDTSLVRWRRRCHCTS